MKTNMHRQVTRAHTGWPFVLLGTLALAGGLLSCSNSTSDEGANESTDSASTGVESDEGTPSDGADETDSGEVSDGEAQATDDVDASTSEQTDVLTTDGTLIDDVTDEVTDEVIDAGGDDSCGATPFGAEQVPASVLIVLDKSGSMTDVPEGFDGDKWSAVKQAVSDALESVQDDVSFGLHLYPFPEGCDMPSDGAVSVEVGPGPQTVPTIVQTLDDTEPSGGTPTAAALAQAFDYFTAGPGKDLDGRKYVLLATDGGPACNEALSCEADECVANLEGRCPEGFVNCCDPEEGGPGAERNCLDDDETLLQVEALHAAGIDTFVVGIPGSEIFSDSLDQFALAGGQALSEGSTSYFAVGDTDALSEVLLSITRDLLTSCELQLESEPPDLDQLNVEVDGELIPQDSDDGWDLDTSTEPPTVILEGATCARVETEGVSSIRVVYGCPTFQPRVR